MRGKRGVKAVGEQIGGIQTLCRPERLIGELDGTRNLAGIRPTAGERRCETRSRRDVGGAGEHIVKLGRQLSRFGTEEIDRRRTEYGFGPPVEVARSATDGYRLVVELCGNRSSTGRAGSFGTVEEHVGGDLIHHTSS